MTETKVNEKKSLISKKKTICDYYCDYWINKMASVIGGKKMKFTRHRNQ